MKILSQLNRIKIPLTLKPVIGGPGNAKLSFVAPARTVLTKKVRYEDKKKL